MRKFKTLLSIFLGLSQFAMSQHIEEGTYNDWDYGPHGLYGNYKVSKVKDRKYFKLSKAGPGKYLSEEVIESGVVTNTATVYFVDGLLSKVEQANQWGEIYEYRNYTKVGKDSFRVSIMAHGKNTFLPGKYALYIYNKELLVEVQYFSFTDRLAEDKNGVAFIRYKRYDDSIRFAERRETAFFDARGNPVISKSAGYHKVVSEYDDRDNDLADAYLGNQDQSIGVRGSEVSGKHYVYDEDNNRTETVNIGVKGDVVPDLAGIAKIRNEFDRGNLLTETRYDSLNRKTRSLSSGDGVAIIRFEYDNAGNIVRESFFDTAGKPMNNQAGVQEFAVFYSPDNMITQLMYFDAFGKPCSNDDGIHSIFFVRDKWDRVIQQANFDIGDKPLKTKTEEVYIVRSKYDEYGRLISNSYWADSVTKMVSWNGTHESTTKYNMDGQAIEYGKLDINGLPFRSEDGSSRQQLIYDSAGNLSERRFLHNDVLVNRLRGFTMNYAILKYAFDEYSRVSELSFWGADHQAVDAAAWIDDSVAVHRIVLVYRGSRVVEERFYKVGESEPSRIIDCIKHDFVNGSGISKGKKIAE